MRALIVTNMYPTPTRPALGGFVRDQVQALRRTGAAEIEVASFPAGGAGAYLKAARRLRREHAGGYDVVHAHFGLSGWPALAVPARVRLLTLHGTDLNHPRSRPVTLSATRRFDLVAAVSPALARTVPRWAVRRPVAVLPCGVDLHRFRPIPRSDARRALGLDPDRPLLLFPSDPARPEKRFALARAVAGDTELAVLRDVAPERVPLWVNAANAVLVPSEREGFGLATLEALACDVPVLATPVGIAPSVLDGLAGALCERFDAERWRAALAPLLATPDPRVEGRSRAEALSSDVTAQWVLDAWQALLDH